MTRGARLAAAIEVLADIEARRRPAADALKDWGLAHRFAGSGDRAAIGGLVFDALRRRSSAAFLMGAATPRAILLGALSLARGLSAEAIAQLADGTRHSPAPLDAAERTALEGGSGGGGAGGGGGLDEAPAPVRGDYPPWLDPALAKVFGDERAEEAAALAHRAPVDLRVNTLKGNRETAAQALAHYGAVPTPWSPSGLRIALSAEAKSPPIHAEPAFIDGLVEIQDEASQLAALLSGARPGEFVIDLCAGSGGKTLALAALMENRGRIVATDTDLRRLAPIHGRLARAGAGNVEVRTPRGRSPELLGDLAHSADLVVIDAPCTGVGAWRRNPDAKWRLRPGALELRMKDQAALLDRAAALVQPGGRIAYITCSLLDEENGSQVRGFLGRHAEFAVIAAEEVVQALEAGAAAGTGAGASGAGVGALAEAGAGSGSAAFRAAVLVSAEGLLMTPRRTGTDGFFIALIRRR